MKNKKILIITLIFVCIISILVLILYILLQTRPSETVIINPPASYPDDNNVVSLNPKDIQQYEYTNITTSDTIELRALNNDRFVIHLDQRGWRNLTWSPDNKLIAVLGQSTIDIFDLYIYNTDSQSWIKATNYTSAGAGIDDYVWVNNDVIMYTQGVSPNKWLHSYTYSAQSEIVKIKKVEGTIINFSETGEKLVLKEADSLNLYNLNGELQKTFTTLALAGEIETKIDNIFFLSDPTTLILVSEEPKIYLHNITANTTTYLEALDHELTNFSPVCVDNKDNLIGFHIENTRAQMYSINTDTGVVTLKATRDFEGLIEVNAKRAKCYDDSTLLVNISANDGEGWYTNKGAELVRVSQLDAAIESAPKN